MEIVEAGVVVEKFGACLPWVSPWEEWRAPPGMLKPPEDVVGVVRVAVIPPPRRPAKIRLENLTYSQQRYYETLSPEKRAVYDPGRAAALRAQTPEQRHRRRLDQKIAYRLAHPEESRRVNRESARRTRRAARDAAAPTVPGARG